MGKPLVLTCGRCQYVDTFLIVEKSPRDKPRRAEQNAVNIGLITLKVEFLR